MTKGTHPDDSKAGIPGATTAPAKLELGRQEEGGDRPLPPAAP